MTRTTRKTIAALGRKLRDYHWELHDGRIRQVAIDATDDHEELALCPLATAATHAAERIDKLAGDPRHAGFAEKLQTWQPETLEHLVAAEPDTTTESANHTAKLYTAAEIIHDDFGGALTALVLGIDPTAAKEIAEGADEPDCETGRALMRALSSPHNLLRQAYEARYGETKA